MSVVDAVPGEELIKTLFDCFWTDAQRQVVFLFREFEGAHPLIDSEITELCSKLHSLRKSLDGKFDEQNVRHNADQISSENAEDDAQIAVHQPSPGPDANITPIQSLPHYHCAESSPKLPMNLRAPTEQLLDPLYESSCNAPESIRQSPLTTAYTSLSPHASIRESNNHISRMRRLPIGSLVNCQRPSQDHAGDLTCPSAQKRDDKVSPNLQAHTDPTKASNRVAQSGCNSDRSIEISTIFMGGETIQEVIPGPYDTAAQEDSGARQFWCSFARPSGEACIKATPSSDGHSHLSSKRKSHPETGNGSKLASKKAKLNGDILLTELNEAVKTAPLALPRPIQIFTKFTTGHGDDLVRQRWILTHLFFSIGSPDAIRHLHEACLTARKRAGTFSGPRLAHGIRRAMHSLDDLEANEQLASITRRFYLTELVEARDIHQRQCLGAFTSRQFNAQLPTRSLKYGYEKIRSVRLSSGKRVAASDALRQLVLEAYPDLAHKNRASEFEKKYAVMKTRLTKGRNWHLLRKQFSVGILALLTFRGVGNLRSQDIETIPRSTFENFLSMLADHRGAFLRSTAEQAEQILIDLLLGQKITSNFVLENMEPNTIEQADFDSPLLLRACAKL